MITAKAELAHLAKTLTESEAGGILALIRLAAPETYGDEPLTVRELRSNLFGIRDQDSPLLPCLVSRADCRCHFCGAQATREQAIESGWIPSFWRGDDEIGSPVCPRCATRHLNRGDDGEYFDDRNRPAAVGA